MTRADVPTWPDTRPDTCRDTRPDTCRDTDRAYGPSRNLTDPTAMPDLAQTTSVVEQQRRAFVATIMGLPVSVHVRGPQARGAEVAALVDRAFGSLRADDAMFSLWKPDSPASRIRRGQLTVDEAGPRMREVAELCDEASRRTGGAFKAWLPGPEGTRLFDPTGMVKGWALQRAFDQLFSALRDVAPHDLLMSGGGDVVVACSRTDTPDWQVAVEDPRERSRTLLRIPLRRGAVATSGMAARGEHIVDPRSGRTPAGVVSATVVGPSLVWADAYATAAFVDGERCETWLSSWPDHAAFLVHEDGSTTVIGSR